MFEDSPFQSVFELSEQRTGRVLTPHCQIQVLQLDKIQHPLTKNQSLLSHWAHFLANRDASRYDELSRLDAGIQDAMTTLKSLSQDEKTRLLAKAREDAARMNYESHRVSHEQGVEQGIAEGEAQALRRLLVKRFGALPARIQAAVENASIKQLRAWFDLAVEARVLEDLFSNNVES